VEPETPGPPTLRDFAVAVEGLIAWAKDHGADRDAMAGLERMRRQVLRRSR
jgi:hypothetical protein